MKRKEAPIRNVSSFISNSFRIFQVICLRKNHHIFFKFCFQQNRAVWISHSTTTTTTQGMLPSKLCLLSLKYFTWDGIPIFILDFALDDILVATLVLSLWSQGLLNPWIYRGIPLLELMLWLCKVLYGGILTQMCRSTVVHAAVAPEAAIGAGRLVAEAGWGQVGWGQGSLVLIGGGRGWGGRQRVDFGFSSTHQFLSPLSQAVPLLFSSWTYPSKMAGIGLRRPIKWIRAQPYPSFKCRRSHANGAPTAYCGGGAVMETSSK